MSRWRSTWTDALLASLLVVGAVLFAPVRAQDDMLAGAAVTDTAEVTPLTIFGSKVAAWYRPDAGFVSVDGSSNVTQLDDRSTGGTFDMTAIGGTPLLVTDSGDPAIDFERTDTDALGVASAALTNEPIVFYAVAKLESTSSVKTLACISDGPDATLDLWRLYVNSTPAAAVDCHAAGSSASATHATVLSTGVRYVFRGDFTADDARAVNVGAGTAATNATSRTVGTTNYTSIGARRGGGAFGDAFDGMVYEVVILNAAPSAGENTAYLAYTTSRFSTP